MFRVCTISQQTYFNCHIIVYLFGVLSCFCGVVLCLELPRKTKAGKGLVIYHGQALVIQLRCL
jgi:serine acetyltransferase